MKKGVTMKQVLKKVLASAAILSMVGAGSSALAVDPDKLPQQDSTGSQAKHSFNDGRRSAGDCETELPKKKPVRDTEEMSEFLACSSSEQDSALPPENVSDLPPYDIAGRPVKYAVWKGTLIAVILENGHPIRRREIKSDRELLDFLEYSPLSLGSFYLSSDPYALEDYYSPDWM